MRAFLSNPQVDIDAIYLYVITYEYPRPELSRDTFLRVAVNVLGLDISSDEDIDTGGYQMPPKFTQFVGMLLDQIFLPLKARGNIAPQPSPAQLSGSARSLQESLAPLNQFHSYLRDLLPCL
ncbi:hypothetical protein GX51_07971 [Blastomyces parvus]|uniref:Uncharacterized protein n=1 Tax=Blastomyces parvus TaxID=2060905 RepID=A0A2B7WHR4_9EURO|nr:hypothetical protein GX51_07971 [Blastomyces parvus]